MFLLFFSDYVSLYMAVGKVVVSCSAELISKSLPNGIFLRRLIHFFIASYMLQLLPFPFTNC